MDKYSEKVKERELEAFHIIIASFLSGFSEIGVLNQAVVNSVVKKMAERLMTWFRLHKLDPGILPEDTPVVRIKKTSEFLNTILRLAQQVETIETDEGPMVSITGNTCRICPIGVGEAEIPGTACPFPALIQNIVNNFSPDGKAVKIKIRNFNILTKESGQCKVFFEN
jgi:hypothetical protein